MVAPRRRGSRPIDAGSPSASAGGDHGWLHPRRPDLMVAYAYSTSGGTSGTFSTTYTSSRGSLSGELDRRVEDDEEKAKRRQRAKGVVEEFCLRDGDIGALKRWLSEMGVGWVLDLSEDPSAETSSLLLRAQRNLTLDWTRALTEITESTLRFVREQDVLAEQDVLGPVQLVFKETVLKMFPFVDALLLAAADLDATNGLQPLLEKLQLQTLLCVSVALHSASSDIKLSLQCCDSSVGLETQRRSDEVLRLVSAKKRRLDKAIWKTMEDVRTIIRNDDDDDNEWGIKNSHGSPDICKVTRSLVTYIKFLWDDYREVDRIVHTAAELEVKLGKRSESFPDDSLRFLFLINNTYFIWQHLHPLSVSLSRMEFHMLLTPKIEDYIQKYLQVSWQPVLSCLHNHTPNYCFRTNSALAALTKFDSEFQKTYTAQKLWKVPDPELRTRLRKAIVEKVISGLTRYLEHNNVTNPGVTPQEREDMLLELFEG
ncbi:unnamed protein product [Urochloa humidicola]